MEARLEELDALLKELETLANDDELNACGPAGHQLLQTIQTLLRAIEALL